MIDAAGYQGRGRAGAAGWRCTAALRAVSCRRPPPPAGRTPLSLPPLALQAALCHSKVVRMLCRTLEGAPTTRARGAALAALQVCLH